MFLVKIGGSKIELIWKRFKYDIFIWDNGERPFLTVTGQEILGHGQTRTKMGLCELIKQKFQRASFDDI